jgi:hypothetical protein
MIKVELHEETVDSIVQSVLKSHLDMMKADLKRMKKIKNKQPFQLEDIEDTQNYLDAIKVTYGYFGGKV